MASLEVEFVIVSHCRNNLMRKRQSIHQKKTDKTFNVHLKIRTHRHFEFWQLFLWSSVLNLSIATRYSRHNSTKSNYSYIVPKQDDNFIIDYATQHYISLVLQLRNPSPAIC